MLALAGGPKEPFTQMRCFFNIAIFFIAMRSGASADFIVVVVVVRELYNSKGC